MPAPLRRRSVAVLIALVLSLTGACTGDTSRVASATTSISATTSTAAPTPELREIGGQLGMLQETGSWGTNAYDYDHDGWTDLWIGRHGTGPGMLYRNTHAGGASTGFVVAHQFVDTIHDRVDRHNCSLGDVNRDGLTDIFCAKGAQIGTSKKWSELWIQGPKGEWTDRAHAYGVEDVWGRGRANTFIDLDHDKWPDLFVGNDIPRQDNHSTANRTYIDVSGADYQQVRLGVTKEEGAYCVQAVDENRDGWDDLLICGKEQVLLYRRIPGSGFRQVGPKLNVPVERSYAARLIDVSGDGRTDLVIVTGHEVTVQLRKGDGSFTQPVFRRALTWGHGLAVGDIDGDGDRDLFVVQACADRVDQPDFLLKNDGTGRAFGVTKLPGLSDACGDAATSLDFDRDGKAEFVATNGGGPDQPLDLHGPVQVFTMGTWQPPG